MKAEATVEEWSPIKLDTTPAALAAVAVVVSDPHSAQIWKKEKENKIQLRPS